MEGFSPIVAGMWRLADWNFTTPQLLDYIDTCIELTVTSFDHADIYGDYSCEELFGAALAARPELRAKIQLITKCDIKLISSRRPEHRVKQYDSSREHILASLDNSLRMLQTDFIDLLLLHRPDPLMNADETARALIELKTAGKVRKFGVSNFSPSQFELLQSRLDFPLITNQIEFSVLHPAPLEDGTLDQCQRLRMSPMAWSPFGGGRLFADQSDQAVRVRSTLERIAGSLEASIDQAALAWILKHPSNIVPVLGTGKIDRVRKACEVMQIRLTREQWFEIWEASTGHEVP